MKKAMADAVSRRRMLNSLAIAVGGFFSACSGSATAPTANTQGSTRSSMGSTSTSSYAITATETDRPYPDIMGNAE
jgi:hypothetical protein